MLCFPLWEHYAFLVNVCSCLPWNFISVVSHFLTCVALNVIVWYPILPVTTYPCIAVFPCFIPPIFFFHHSEQNEIEFSSIFNLGQEPVYLMRWHPNLSWGYYQQFIGTCYSLGVFISYLACPFISVFFKLSITCFVWLEQETSRPENIFFCVNLIFRWIIQFPLISWGLYNRCSPTTIYILCSLKLNIFRYS